MADITVLSLLVKKGTGAIVRVHCQFPSVRKTDLKRLPELQSSFKCSSSDSYQRRNRSSSALDLRPKLDVLSVKTPVKSEKSKAKSLSEDIRCINEKVKAILDSVEEKKTPPLRLGETCREIRALPPSWKEKTEDLEDIDGKQAQIGSKTKDSSRDYKNYLANHLKKFEIDKSEADELDEENVDENDKQKPVIDTTADSPAESTKMDKPSGRTTPGYQIAKRYHDENLKHQPLPDIIEDPVFKALGSSGHPNPAYELRLQPNASAIGWRGYGAPGPTQCSKMRIYRPKTAVMGQKGYKNQRPKTSDPKLNTAEKHPSQMDLAICWDLIPEDPSDEPKPSPHIDGSNGSVAPAVFSIVHPESKEDIPKKGGSPDAVAERILPDIQSDNAANLPSKNGDRPYATNKEAIMAHIKPPSNSSVSSKHHSTPNNSGLNSVSTIAAEIARKNPKTAWTSTEASKTLSEKLMDLQKENNNPNIMNGNGKSARRNTVESQGSLLSRKKQYQSSPNLVSAGCQTNRECNGSNCGTEKSSRKGSDERLKNNSRINKIRSCEYCDKVNLNSVPNHVNKTEFKSAFKAGVPNNSSSSSSTPPLEKPLKIPKMRLPYAKRSYSITTLIPPFSLWPDHHGQQYPEHWRLASVYQHSYKPLDYRKKSLLAGVYQ